MTQERRKDDHHPDRPLDWSDTETLAGQEWKAPAAPQAVAGKGEVPEGVYYSFEHDNFYKQGSAEGMSQLFYERWRDHKFDFPAAPAIPSPDAAEDEPVAWMVRNPEAIYAEGIELFRYYDSIPARLLPPLANPVPLYARASLSSPAERQEAEACAECNGKGVLVTDGFRASMGDPECSEKTCTDCDGTGSAPPASAEPVLTESRIKELANANRGPKGVLINDISFARAVEREVTSRLATPSSPPKTAGDGWKWFADKAVDVLQRHIVPDGLSDHAALLELYAIFDGPEYRDMGTIPQMDCDMRQAREASLRKQMEAYPVTPSSPSVSGTVDTNDLHRLAMDYRGAPISGAQAAWEILESYVAQAVRAAREEASIVGWNDALTKARAELSERQNHLETFGPYSEEAARIALDGAIDTLDELKRTPQAAGTEQEKKQ